MKTAIAGIVIIIIVAIGGWYVWSTSQQASAPAGPAPSFGAAPTSTSAANGLPAGTPVPTTDGTSIRENLTLGITSSSAFGNYLIGFNGKTLYYYVPDGITGTSTCYDQCAAIWPPYTIPYDFTPNLQAGVIGQVTTVVRTDGTTQLVYDGHPLYFYSGDTTGDDVNGEGLGGVWFVIKP